MIPFGGVQFLTISIQQCFEVFYDRCVTGPVSVFVIKGPRSFGHEATVKSRVAAAYLLTVQLVLVRSCVKGQIALICPS